MATLSQFFGDAIASGQSEYITDPRKMDWVVFRLPYTKVRRQTAYHAGQSNFWDYNLFYCNRDSTATDIAFPNATGMSLPTTNMHPTKLADPTLKWGNQIQVTDADLGNFVELANVSGKSGFYPSPANCPSDIPHPGNAPNESSLMHLNCSRNHQNSGYLTHIGTVLEYANHETDYRNEKMTHKCDLFLQTPCHQLNIQHLISLRTF